MGDGPPRFPRGSTCPAVLGYLSREAAKGGTNRPPRFVYEAITLYGPAFQPVPLRVGFVTPRIRCSGSKTGPTTPTEQRLQAMRNGRFRLIPVRSPLLGESLIWFPFLRVLRCFSSPRSPPFRDSGGLTPEGCPIRRPPDQCLLAAPRGLSQLSASFIASRHQGIHHVPLVA